MRDLSFVKALVLVGVVALSVYLNALSSGFLVDDHQTILNNRWITESGHVGEIFSSGDWDHAGRASSYYRPMYYYLYRVVFLLLGTEPWALHVLNILLHVGTSLLVFLTARRIFGGLSDSSASVAPALVAGLLFAAHPIHTEAIAWIAALSDPSYAFFSLLALFLYIHPDRRLKIRSSGAVLAFFVATLCKEPAFTLPLVLVAYDLLLRKEEFSLQRSLGRWLPFGAAAVISLALRYRALGGLVPVETEVNLSVSQYMINVLHLFSRYLELLAVPVGLTYWHAFRPITSLVSLEGLRTVTVLAVFAGLVWLARRHSPAALFGLIVIIVPLLPAFHVSALNQGIESALAERYLYLPSFGFVLVLAAIAASVLRARPASRAVVLAAAIGLTLLYGAATVARNPVWKSSYTLWADAIEKSEGSAVVQASYGFALLGQGRVDEGRHHLRIANELDPGLADLKIQNAIAFAARGRLSESIFELQAALELEPRSAVAHFNLAIVYADYGWTASAMEHFRQAIAIAPGYANAHNNLGILYAQGGQRELAEQHLETAVRLDPGHPDYRANLERLRSR